MMCKVNRWMHKDGGIMIWKSKEWMDKWGHFEVEIKGWMQKGAILRCKLKWQMDKTLHYYVEMKGSMHKGGHYYVQIKRGGWIGEGIMMIEMKGWMPKVVL